MQDALGAGQGPELVSEVLSRLFLSRGWGRHQVRVQLERAWKQAVGDSAFYRTRLGALRQRTLEVLVADAVLFQELAAFRKRSLIQAMNEHLGTEKVCDIRFQLGSVS
jgi:hypothetical protein